MRVKVCDDDSEQKLKLTKPIQVHIMKFLINAYLRSFISQKIVPMLIRHCEFFELKKRFSETDLKNWIICSTRSVPKNFQAHLYNIYLIEILFINMCKTQNCFVSSKALSIFSYLQTWSNDYIQLLNKPYENKVTLTWHNPPLKCC